MWYKEFLFIYLFIKKKHTGAFSKNISYTDV